MKEKIKEILDYLKIENGTIGSELSYKETHLLLDYITDLQEENESLKDEKPEYILRWKLEEQLEDYKSRIDKAISLLKEAGCYDEETKTFCDDVWYELPDLLNILQGEDK